MVNIDRRMRPATSVTLGDVYVNPGPNDGGPYGYGWSNSEPPCVGATLNPGESCNFRAFFAGTGICPYPEPTGVSYIDYLAESADQTIIYASLHVTFRFVCP
jgi:hypothetical protein